MTNFDEQDYVTRYKQCKKSLEKSYIMCKLCKHISTLQEYCYKIVKRGRRSEQRDRDLNDTPIWTLTSTIFDCSAENFAEI